jgi:ankyrin repeat protein
MGRYKRTQGLLIKHGAEVNVVDDEYFTPLDIAVGENHDGIRLLLLEHGALSGDCLREDRLSRR